MVKNLKEWSRIFHAPTYRRQEYWCFRATEILAILGLRTTCRGGGMADAADLKSSLRLLT